MTIIFTVLILCVTIRSGFANSSSAITGCVSARSMSPEGATRLAAICTFAGSVIITRFDPRVSRIFFGIADFGEDSACALLSLCASLCSVLLLSFLSHKIGIPTSNSHALVSGMTGAALARKMSFSAINTDEWKLIFLGFLLSTLPAFLSGFIFNTFLQAFLTKILKISRRGAISHFKRSQKWSAAWNAALHGAQECQKFTGVYMLGITLSSLTPQKENSIPLSVLILCALSLTLGTMMGGSNVIKKVGIELCELDAPAYSAASAAASFVVTICTLFGLPADILQARACAVAGVGISAKKHLNARVAAQIAGAWILTFPVCLCVGFILSYIAQNYFIQYLIQ